MSIAVETVSDRASEVVEKAITPFVKWAGGKGQLLAQLKPVSPPSYDRYVEPFIGGGALFFALRPKVAVLGDLNAELVLTYQQVRDAVEDVISALDRHLYDRDHFYAVRQQLPNSLTPSARAARFIYLNKTGYNGLYRVNRKGQFNVPFGRYRTAPRLYDPLNLRAASRLLQGAVISESSYLVTLSCARPGDFVYLDPPYQPISASSNFTRYTKEGFGAEDQQRLADEFRRLDRTGCRVLLSNSDTEFVRQLYQGFRLEVVRANRLINSDSTRRAGITELVIRNY